MGKLWIPILVVIVVLVLSFERLNVGIFNYQKIASSLQSEKPSVDKRVIERRTEEDQSGQRRAMRTPENSNKEEETDRTTRPASRRPIAIETKKPDKAEEEKQEELTLQDPCCQWLTQMKNILISMPSDIANLLPILHAYYSESDVQTMLEAGSRGGKSTVIMLDATRKNVKKRCSTMDLIITSSVSRAYHCERKCLNGRDLQSGFVTSEGNDLLASIPFVHEQNRTGRVIDAMFIDTLHNGDLLMMELKRFPRYVRKYLLFHDSYLFRKRDESSKIKAIGFPEGKPRPIGLHQALKDFLLGEGSEWEEEMNNIHNNGLYILRRKEVRPLTPRSITPKQRLEDSRKVMAYVKNAPILKPTELGTLCTNAYQNMTRGIPSVKSLRESKVLCWVDTAFFRSTRWVHIYHHILQNPQHVYMAPLLPLLLSHVVAVAELGNKQVLYYGCDVAPLVTLLHGAKYDASGDAAVYIGKQSSSICSNFQGTVMSEHVKFLDISKQSEGDRFRADLVVVSANSLKTSRLQQVFLQSKGRIIIYGLSTIGQNAISSALSLIPSKFVLKQSLLQHGGLAMWEHQDSTSMLYVPEAKNESR